MVVHRCACTCVHCTCVHCTCVHGTCVHGNLYTSQGCNQLCAFNQYIAINTLQPIHVPNRYIPFSGGPRKCVGDQFALMEAVVALAVTVRGFEFELVPGKVCRGGVCDQRCVWHVLVNTVFCLCHTGGGYDHGGNHPYTKWHVHVCQGACRGAWSGHTSNHSCMRNTGWCHRRWPSSCSMKFVSHQNNK